MRLTNQLGLPEPLVAAVAADEYQRGDAEFTVSELIAPPQQAALIARHGDALAEDAADRIWMLFGSACHSILERAGAGVPGVHERRITATLPVGDAEATISGQPDRLAMVRDGGRLVLQDYKTTSVYSVRDGGKDDWHVQMNIYRWLILMAAGIVVDALQIIALCRDWRPAEARRQRDYPPHQVVTLDVPKWSMQDTLDYLFERVTIHRAARACTDDAQLPPCTDAERWARPATYAVMKRGRKSAVKLHDTREAAELHAYQAGPQHTVEERPAVYPRCEGYCPAAPVCQQWQATQRAAAARIGCGFDEALEAVR